MLCSHVVLRQSLRRCHARLASTAAAAAAARKPPKRSRKTPISAALEQASTPATTPGELPVRRGRGRPRKTAHIDGNAPATLVEPPAKPSRKTSVKDGKGVSSQVAAAAAADVVKRTIAKARTPKTPVTKRSPSPKRRQSLLAPPQKHHDLASFLEYAERANLKKGTTVYKGHHYEYTVVEALKRYNFTLQKMGRQNDLGIDLLGTWHLPAEPHELRIIISCKASKPKPCFVRELEGAYVGAPAGWRGQDVMALLVTRDPATPGVRDALQRSRLPMGFAQITELGYMQQLMWNHAAQESRLTGMSVTNTYRKPEGEPLTSSVGGRLPGAISLLWMGKQWSSKEKEFDAQGIPAAKSGWLCAHS